MKIFKLAGIMLLMAFSPKMMAEESSNQVEMVVYRSPTCGCCGKWTEHVQENQFKIKSVITDDMQAIKAKYGVPDKLASCHTAIVDGYVVEGHVPADDIKKLLQIKPNVAGIAAPGMPLGSPGMEMGGQKQVYRVISFDKQGGNQVFAEH